MFKRILATVDIADELAEKVLQTASALARAHNATLEAVTVWPPVSSAALSGGGDAGAGAVVASQAALEQHRVGRADCEKRFHLLIKNHAPDASPVVLDGEPGESTAAYAEENSVDLLVTGSHQRGFWAGLLAGSASREIVNDAPCAVLVVTKKFAERK